MSAASIPFPAAPAPLPRLSPLALRAQKGGWLHWAILITASLGAILEVIDVSIVNVALPHMQGNLGVTLSEVSWVSTGYAVANVIVIPLTAWLGRKFGRKNYFLFSLVLFVASSLMCGMAQNLPMLVVSRILQGFGGGVLLANAQSVIFENFPPSQRSVAQAIFGLGVIVGPAIGPTLGGYLTENLGWRWIFFINLPVGIIAIALSVIFLPGDTHAKDAGRVDWLGIGLLAGGLGALQMMLEEGQQDDWFESGFIVALAVCSVLSLIAFVWWELKTKSPAVDLRVLRHRSVAAGSVYSVILGAGLYGVIFAVPVFAQNNLHFNAVQTGNLMAPGAFTSAIVMILLAKVAKVVDARVLVAIGGVLTAMVAFQLAGITPLSGAEDLFWPLLWRGGSSVMMFLPLSLATLGPVPREDVAASAGLYSLTRQLGGSIGIALITVLLSNRIDFHEARLADRVTVSSPATRDWLSKVEAVHRTRGSDPVKAGKQAQAELSGTIRAQAAVLSYGDVFRCVGIAFLVSLPLVFFLGKGGASDAAGAAH